MPESEQYGAVVVGPRSANEAIPETGSQISWDVGVGSGQLEELLVLPYEISSDPARGDEFVDEIELTLQEGGILYRTFARETVSLPTDLFIDPHLSWRV